MKILTSSQIRDLDAYTIANEPVSSWGLMERASKAFVQWLWCKFDEEQIYHIFCGKGNNGGDGLAIGRMLSQRGCSVNVYVIEHREEGTADYTENLQKLQGYVAPVHIREQKDLQVPSEGIVIDALLGSGLNKPADGIIGDAIGVINSSGLTVVSVDIASGLFADRPVEGSEPSSGLEDPIVRPDFTVSFQVPKPVFLIPEYYPFVGEWHVVDIGLHSGRLEQASTNWYLTTRENLPHLKKKRGKYSHKGTYGHALLVAGSYGKMGAAVLAAQASLRSGVGLLTAYIPKFGYDIMQTRVPEAMTITDPGDRYITTIPDYAPYSAVGIGPGLGTATESRDAFGKILETFSGPVVLDADALNMLAADSDLWDFVPENAILTPHPKEFARLAGASANGYETISRAQALAEKHSVIICLKGAHTAVVLPNQSVFFNCTGNPGMATGGSGDVLTGVILGLLAQGYAPDVAARLAVFKHGEAGDRVASFRSQEALIASDLIDNLRW